MEATASAQAGVPTEVTPLVPGKNIDANRDVLTAERADAQLTGQRLIASVQLIKALGGGWQSKQ